MEPFIFHEGEVPSGYTTSFEVSIFNRPQHLKLQSDKPWTSFYILNSELKTVDALIHFHIEDGVAKSPFRSPFGSFEVADNLPAETIFGFIVFVEKTLTSREVKRIVIKNPPEAYFSAGSRMLATYLLNQGFQVTNAELSSLITVSKTPFEEILHPRKKRKLKQSEVENFDFKVEQLTALDSAYHFISKFREEKRFKLSMSLGDLEKAFHTFPKDFILFGLHYYGNLVGASIAIKVNQKILYHFISDYVRRIGNTAPGLLLMRGIYRYCQAQEISQLDLGTSAILGKPNFKLLNFKTEIGGIPSSKFTFSKDIH